jgi:MarR family multiple gene transcriptional regulator MgrA
VRDEKKIVIGKLKRMDCLMKRNIERKVSATGVYRSQHQLLMQIAHHPKSSQIEIAERMDISPAAVAVSLKKLERGGYIKKDLDTADNRIHQIQVTQKGQEVVEKSHLIFEEMEKTIFKGFTEEEIKKTGELLERMCQNLSQAQEES